MMRAVPIIVASLLTVLLMVGCGIASGGPATAPTVFGEALGKGWVSREYSWKCRADYAATPGAGQTTYACSATLDGWGGLAYANSAPPRADDFAALTMMVRGAVGGEVLRVALYDPTGAELPTKGGIKLTAYLPGGITTQYQLVTIPLSAFVPAGQQGTRIAKVSVMSDRESPETIFIDEVRFVADKAKP